MLVTGGSGNDNYGLNNLTTGIRDSGGRDTTGLVVVGDSLGSGRGEQYMREPAAGCVGTLGARPSMPRRNAVQRTC